MSDNTSKARIASKPAPVHPRDIAARAAQSKTVMHTQPAKRTNQEPTAETKTRKAAGLAAKMLGKAASNLQHRKNCIHNQNGIVDISGNFKAVSRGESVVCQHGKLMHAYHSTVLGYDCWTETDPMLNPVRYTMNRGKMKNMKVK